MKLSKNKNRLHMINSHAPHGACELKFCAEMSIVSDSSHAPHGACELKSNVDINITGSKRHAPHGACELKCLISEHTR